MLVKTKKLGGVWHHCQSPIEPLLPSIFNSGGPTGESIEKQLVGKIITRGVRERSRRREPRETGARPQTSARCKTRSPQTVQLYPQSYWVLILMLRRPPKATHYPYATLAPSRS